jgi:hypothetical protein
MFKNLSAILCLLVFPYLASAADFYWNSNVAEGDWSVASNWKLGGTATSPLATSAPTTADQAWIRPSLNGSISAGPVTINVTTTDAVTSRLNMNFGTFTLNVQSGAVLTNSGTLTATGWQFYACTNGVVNIDGTLKNERSDSTAITVKIGGAGSGGWHTININSGGVMTVKQTALHNGVFGIGNTAVGGGHVRVNIAAGGLLDVDSYTFGTLVDKKLTIYGGGLMKVRGDAVSQINADITAGYIVGQWGNSAGLGVWTQTEGGQTYTYVPEPTTLALLALGGLFLRRKIIVPITKHRVSSIGNLK